MLSTVQKMAIPIFNLRVFGIIKDNNTKLSNHCQLLITKIMCFAEYEHEMSNLIKTGT